jgi:AmmeMemoRadiSam system radical SAM enzyme/AmmeMemoRadiSam system protein B/AmmeMemoRadiSam system protein A
VVRVVSLPPEEGLEPDGTRVAGWWEETGEPGRVLCRLCPRGCTLGPGERGFCFVRQNRDGRLVSTTYGRSTGFCVDPIEKKPLNQFYPGSAVLSFGTPGCNLGCRFCQNWTTTKSRDVDRLCEPAAPEAIAEAAVRLGCPGVAFTYNDPIVWAEYAVDAAVACRRRGVRTVAVTSGYMRPEPREAFYRHIDAANVDLKAFNDDFYRRLAGGRLEPVLDTLRWLAHKTEVWLEITNLLIPQENDSPGDIERMCRWIHDELGPDVPLHFSAFHPDFRMTDHAPTPPATLTLAHGIARRAGLRYVYTGNVVDREHQATYCPGCGRAVIERDGFSVREYHIRNGRCAHCGTVIAGRFNGSPGDWNGRRLSVRIADYAGPACGAGVSPAAAAGTAAPQERGEPPAAAEDRSCSAVLPGTVERPVLSPDQQRRVFRAAGCRVAAAVRSEAMARPVDRILADVAATPVYGAFVSLKRGGHLRSCCGFLGSTLPLGEALDHAAVRAAKDDPRFPPISLAELDQLDMDVWLLWGLRPVAARGRDRIGAITIGKHGLQIARGAARGLLLPGVAVEHHLDARGFLEQVCLKAGLPRDAWLEDNTTLMTFEGHALSGRLAEATAEEDQPETPAEGAVGGNPARAGGPPASGASQGRGGAEVRPPAVAGGFYPGSPEAVRRAVDELLAPQGEKAAEKPAEKWAAAMVPHAGWIYSGRLAAAVLRRLQIPPSVIVLCPKHRPGGAEWALAPYARWAFPGGELAADRELAERLAAAVTGLALDDTPHRQEHAIEVQLPLLSRLAPDTRLVGITIGGGDWAALRQFAGQLAGVLRALPETPLLLISSDMNHFATQSETWRLDRLALEALESLDPQRLLETVQRHQISMCGVRPAVIVLETLRQLGALHRSEIVGYLTSADASHDTRRVVGYAGVLLG